MGQGAAGLFARAQGGEKEKPPPLLPAQVEFYVGAIGGSTLVAVVKNTQSAFALTPQSWSATPDIRLRDLNPPQFHRRHNSAAVDRRPPACEWQYWYPCCHQR